MNALAPRTYVINFFAQTSEDNRHMAEFVTNNPKVSAYWNYIPLIYCVKSYASATELSFALAEILPMGNFLVAEVNLENINGRLPRAAWDWFYAPINPHPQNALAATVRRS